MPEYLAPGAYFESVDTGDRAITGVRTDVAGFVGLAERGPVDRPVRLESFDQFEATFGSFLAEGFLAYAVKAFFENGGDTCVVVRVAHAPVPARATLAGIGGGPSLEVEASSPGRWGNALAVRVTPAPDTLTFSLTVSWKGRLREAFSSLSLDPAAPRYVGRIVGRGGSAFIRVDDLAPSTPIADRLPAGGSTALTGGRDGLASLEALDFTGDPGREERRGLRTLELEDAVAIVSVPDIHVRPDPEPVYAPLPVPTPDPCLPAAGQPGSPGLPADPPEHVPEFTLDDVFAVQQAMVAQCEDLRDRVAVLDAPRFSAGDAQIDVAEIQAWRTRFDTRFAALYFPWVLVNDPLRRGGDVRLVPPGGHVAGVWARTDLERGVHHAPANQELRWAQALSVDVNAQVQGLLNPLGINCLRAFAGRGLRVFGARTLSSDAPWRYLNVRRLMSMIEESISEAVQWAVFEPNDFLLRQTLVLTISTFLESLWDRGALVGETPDEAFRVTSDERDNPPGLADNGQLIAEVAVAPVKPAEFVVLRIGRVADELRITEGVAVGAQ